MKTPQFQALKARLHEVDVAEYDHLDLTSVMSDMSKLPTSRQNKVIYESVKVSYTFHQLMEYVRQQFFILYQKDEEGPYSALVFGRGCLSLSTWDGHEDFPSDLDETSYTPEFLDDGETLRSEHLLTFIEFWVEHYRTTLQDFCAGLEKVDM
jgi:hypothetical protein